MNLDDLADEVDKKEIKRDSYIEIQLNNEEIYFGKYSDLGRGGGINLLNGDRWVFYESNQIKSLRRVE